MPIRASAASQVETLIAALASPSAVARDAAVARLTVIGARAVDRLTAVVVRGTATDDERMAALHALEAIGDTRGFEAARAAAAGSSDAVALAGIAVLRRLLRGTKETDAIEALTAIALSTVHTAPRRLAAADALAGLGDTVVAPLAARLAGDRDKAVAAWAAAPRARRTRPARTTESLEALIDGGLPDDPGTVRRALARHGATAPLTALRRAVDAIRDREESAPKTTRTEWSAARAAAHVTLAERGSRIALYDIRESLERATEPLPVELLAAVTTIGDASCLEPLAMAYGRSTASGEKWWREHLRRAFHAIVQRDRITTRHAAMKKVVAKYPAIVR